MSERIVISGASRGLGLEFARQYIGRGAIVFAGCRQPHQGGGLQGLGRQNLTALHIIELDVASQESVERAREVVSSAVDGIDLVINNAGLNPRGEKIASIDFDIMREVFDVNVLGPMRMAQAFLPLLRAGRRPMIINISSQLGSLARATWKSGYSYSGSKAALNMQTKILSNELKADGIATVMMHPGWVRTDMGGQNADLSSEEAVSGMIRVIAGLTPADTGRFLQWNGEELPW